MFCTLIEKTMDIYVDDMLTESKWAEDHVNDLRKTFDILRKYNMKLNPTKCSFGSPQVNFSTL